MDMSNMSGMAGMAGMEGMSGMVMATTSAASATTTAVMDHSGHTMASAVSAVASATAAAAMDMSGMGSHDMGMPGMNVAFSSSWKNYELLFGNFKAANGGAAFGIFLFSFVLAFLLRGLIFFSSYLEQRVWMSSNSVIVAETQQPAVVDCPCDEGEDANEKGSSSSGPTAKQPSLMRQLFFTTFAEFKRDVIRLLIAFVAITVSYVLMLIVMSYIILYFFGVVLGLAFGELWWGRVGRITNISPANGVCISH